MSKRPAKKPYVESSSESSEEYSKPKAKPAKKMPAKKGGKKHAMKGSDEDIDDYNEAIMDHMKASCGHTQYYYYGKSDHVCTKICNLIHECYDNKHALTQATFDCFMSYISCHAAYQMYTYDASRTCLHKNSPALLHTLALLFGAFIPNNDVLKKMIVFNDYDGVYKHLEDNPGFNGLSEEQVKIIVDERLNYSEELKNRELVDFVIKNSQLNVNNITALAGCRNELLSFTLSGLIDKFDGQVTDAMLMAACKALPSSKHSVQSLLNRGLELSSDHFTEVCALCDESSIDYFLQTSRLPIERKHFQALIKSKKYTRADIDDNSGYRWYRYNQKHDPWNESYSMEKMELLIKYGYKPDYDDVLFSAKEKKELPEIERFGIILDQKILDACWDVDFYPVSYNFDCVTPEMIMLQGLCKTRRAAEIKKTLKTHAMVPDRKCMENAACFRSNLPIYNHLKNLGGRPTFKCIKNASKELKGNEYIVTLIDDYEKIMVNDMDSSQNRIKILEAEILKLGGTIPNIDVKEVNIEKMMITESDELDDDDEIVDSSDDLEEEVIVVPGKKTSKKIDDENEFIVVPGKKTGKKKIASKKDNIPETDEIKEIIVKKTLNLTIESDKVVELQKQYRLKTVPPKKMIEIFKCDKNKKLSYSDVKKFLIDKMKTDNWVDEDDKNLINIPQNVRDKLNLEKDGLITFGDIDKLICLMLA